MDVETQTLIFEARIIAESAAIGLTRVSDVSEIEIIRRMLMDMDAILEKAQARLGTN